MCTRHHPMRPWDTLDTAMAVCLAVALALWFVGVCV